MSNPFNRRDFLRIAGVGAAGLTLFAVTGGCEEVVDQIRNRPVRKNANSLSSSDPIIQTYKDAVTAMRGLPSSDNRNWENQSNIHLNHCPHGNWFFLPWHRAYLFYFERICRELTGDDSFALPYWNWTERPTLPSTFWGSGNPLNHPRNINQTTPMPADAVGQTVMESILSSPNFYDIGSHPASAPRGGGGAFGRLEGTPHNTVHGTIGGDMGLYTSPRDPIFWLHHCMIDCCWYDWNGVRGNPNPNDSAWTTYEFDEFYDAQGNATTVDVRTTFLYPLLSYRYETSTKGADTSNEAIAETQSEQASGDESVEELRAFLREGANVQLSPVERFAVQRGALLRIDQPQALQLEVQPRAIFAPMDREDAENIRAILTIDEVSIPDQRDQFVRVFINRPNATSETPITDPGFAGSFAFFNDAEVQDLETMKAKFVLDITDTVKQLRQRGDISDDGQFEVRLVPVSVGDQEPDARQFRVETIELALSSLQIER